MVEPGSEKPQAAPIVALAPASNTPTVEKGKRKNITWEANHAAIRDAYVRLIGDLKRRPTTDELAQMTTLSPATIQNHLKKLKFEPIAHPLRVLTDDVLISIHASAVDGNAASQKLWMQVMEGWRESNIVEAQVDHTVSDTKFAVKVHKAGT
jgi:hypothetical protein